MDTTISVLVVGKSSNDNSMDICLAARAFGAHVVTFEARKNPKLSRYFDSLNKRWGGSFSVSFTNNWKAFIKEHRNYKIVYLTRYGIPINKVEYAIRTYKNILLVVTTAETLKEMHDLSDFNISITNQPHCSSAAIAVFLHQFYQGRELSLHFENAEYKVIPDERKVNVQKLK